MADLITPTPEGLRRATRIVQSGGIIAYPTETVYGLGADPGNEEALERLFALKGRDSGKAIIVLVSGMDDLPGLTRSVPPLALRLAHRFWPGPLTILFPASRTTSARLLGGGTTIGLRHSSAPVTRALLASLGGPLTSTSANLSGHPPARSAAEALSALGSAVDLIIDGGPSPSAQPSTLVDATGARPRLIREGPVTEADIDAALES